jgi:hypothetical protein
MWEVMNNCDIMHNMIIKSEHANPMMDDILCDWEGPLTQVDHDVPTEFETFYTKPS